MDFLQFFLSPKKPPASGVQKMQEGGADFVTAAVNRSAAQGVSSPMSNDIAAAREIADAARTMKNAPAAIEKLVKFVEKFPYDERFQALIARVLERVQDSRAEAVWRGIDARFPESRDAYVRLLRWTIRLQGLEAGRRMHEARFPVVPQDVVALFAYGRGYQELRNFKKAQKAFSHLLERDDTPLQIILRLANLYLGQGQPTRSRRILEKARAKYGETRELNKASERVDIALQSLSRLLPKYEESEGNLKNVLIKRLFDGAIQRREGKIDAIPKSFVGSIVMINGSLGSGGAERQFTNTALALHNAALTGERINDCDILGPIHILCRSLHSRLGASFFEPQFKNAGLRIHEYSHFPEYGGRVRFSCAKDILDFLDHLPSQMKEGIVRLADMLRYIDPSIVHIWQDGSVLATGLAALLANVPRIILGVRTLPPEDRFERDKPEYKVIYQSMLSARGVALISNSHMAARRYEAWLALPPYSVRVVPNGLSPLKKDASSQATALFESFKAQANAFTLGSVMRMDDNKRPLLWLDAAAAILEKEKNAQFIMVGDGPKLNLAKAHAEKIGVSKNVLFTGQSPHVGYWLSHMDAFLLLSRHEGLPNVLIEAQMAGVPVIATAAGGSAETLREGITGSLLSSIDGLEPAYIAEKVLFWRQGSERKRLDLSNAIAEWATENFSLRHMIELTVEAYID